MVRSLLLLLFSLLAFQFGYSQNSYTAQIKGADTGEPLVFVSVQPKGKTLGVYTDLDGYFSILATTGDTLLLRYVGYQAQYWVVPTSTGTEVIPMQTDGVNLSEVVVRPQENPVWRIIRAAIAQRQQHDPQQLAGYRYAAYHKSVLAVDSLGVSKQPRNPKRQTE